MFPITLHLNLRPIPITCVTNGLLRSCIQQGPVAKKIEGYRARYNSIGFRFSALLSLLPFILYFFSTFDVRARFCVRVCLCT